MDALLNKTIGIAADRNSEAIEEMIRKQGGTAVIKSIQGRKWLHEASAEQDVKKLIDTSYDWVILTTGIGAKALEEAAERLGKQKDYIDALKQTKLAIRGSKTIKWLKEKGLSAKVVSSDGTMAELIEHLKQEDIEGRNFFLQLYNKEEKQLIERLTSLPIELYQSLPYHYEEPSEETVGELRNMIAHKQLDALLFTSKTQVQNLFAEKGEGLAVAFNQHVIAGAVGKVTAKELRDFGVKRMIEPEKPKMGALVVALTKYYK
ncbi:uroporphyrinogen-III synthase [Halobacillus sp. Marseille-Q1614]|uniref:uroporphyrinogen-III synthase n=1 Tax=Halobacillus sp. Marseille-Q1614 TaxID=2709134 RepID=UPI00156DA315|nr:uroporphyrinogen-III synthase [Halobacillus sp. Marseille-Q1614]